MCVVVTLYSVCGGHSVQCVVATLYSVCVCVCINVHVVIFARSNSLHGGAGTRIFTIRSRPSIIGPEMTQPSSSFSVDFFWVYTLTTRISPIPCVFTLPSLCSVFNHVQVHSSSEYTGVHQVLPVGCVHGLYWSWVAPVDHHVVSHMTIMCLYQSCHCHVISDTGRFLTNSSKCQHWREGRIRRWNGLMPLMFTLTASSR